MRLPDDIETDLRAQSGRWLITGVAGFIGSNLLQALLERDQLVRGLDNFATGHPRNLDEVRAAVRPDQWARFDFRQGDIRDQPVCQEACRDVHYLLHQAALGSVPGSLADPLGAHATNATGSLQMFLAAHQAGVRRVVYASSCAVYGDRAVPPISENQAANPLSPYAATKCANELYAQALAHCFGLPTVGLRYFNIFGPRQDPQGPYAAVIPKWIAALLRDQPVHIHGDGETTRDFCYVANVVQANLRAALTPRADALNRAYNVASGERISLNQLFALLRDRLAAELPHLKSIQPVHDEFRPGDIRHSQADLTQARQGLGYEPHYRVDEGFAEALAWYKSHLA